MGQPMFLLPSWGAEEAAKFNSVLSTTLAYCRKNININFKTTAFPQSTSKFFLSLKKIHFFQYVSCFCNNFILHEVLNIKGTRTYIILLP